MFNLGGYADAVYLVHFSEYGWRDAYMVPELRRVGLQGNPKLKVRNTGRKPFLKLASAGIAGRNPPDYAIDLVHNTIDILTESLDRGYGRIMVMEDDLAFVKDLSQIDQAFRNLPSGFDVLHMEWVTRDRGRPVPRGKFWVKDPEMRSCGEGCAVFSRSGMERMLSKLSSESPGSWMAIDVASRTIPNCYIASPRLAVQLPFLSSGSGGVEGVAGNVLDEDWDRYALPGDFIAGVGVLPGSGDFKSLAPKALKVLSESRAGKVSDIACAELYRTALSVKSRNPSAYLMAMFLLMSSRPDFLMPYMSMARLMNPSAFPDGERRSLLKMASESYVQDSDPYSIPGPSFGKPSPDVTPDRMEALFREIVDSSEPGDLDGPEGDLVRFAAYQLPEWREDENENEEDE